MDPPCPYSNCFVRFLPLKVRTIIPPSNRITPSQDIGLRTSPTITTLKTAAVKGYPKLSVTAEEEGTFFNPNKYNM